MEMVAASKMKRAQEQALESRPYAVKLQEVIKSLMSSHKHFKHPLTRKNDSNKIMALLISTNKSLCGGLNSNLFRMVYDWSDHFDKENLQFVAVGKKGAEFVARNGFKLLADYSELGEKFEFADTLPISRQLIQSYEKENLKEIYIIYSDFVSTLVQKPKVFHLLPIDPESLQSSEDELEDAKNKEIFLPKEYIIEPNADTILGWLLPYFVELEVYHYILEANASEHSARMVAMKNATDNAKDIVGDLTLTFNKARQAQITAEINETAVASLVLKNE